MWNPNIDFPNILIFIQIIIFFVLL